MTLTDSNSNFNANWLKSAQMRIICKMYFAHAANVTAAVYELLMLTVSSFILYLRPFLSFQKQRC